MLDIDDNDMFIGSPRSKFFSIFSKANKNLVENVLEKSIERFIAMEILLQECLNDEFESSINRVICEDQDGIERGKNDFFMNCVSEILSQHE